MNCLNSLRVSNMSWEIEEIGITRENLYNLFCIHDAMKLLKEWEEFDNEQKADKLFNILIEVKKYK